MSSDSERYPYLERYKQLLQQVGKWDQERVEEVRRENRKDERHYGEGESYYEGDEGLVYSTAVGAVYKLIQSFPTARAASDLPTLGGVYFLSEERCDPESGRTVKNLLYIGSSINLRQRWNTHSYRDVLGNRNFRLRWKLTNYCHFLSPGNEEAFYVSLLTPSLNVIISRCQLRRFPGDVNGGPPPELVEACHKLVEHGARSAWK